MTGIPGRPPPVWVRTPALPMKTTREARCGEFLDEDGNLLAVIHRRLGQDPCGAPECIHCFPMQLDFDDAEPVTEVGGYRDNPRMAAAPASALAAAAASWLVRPERALLDLLTLR